METPILKLVTCDDYDDAFGTLKPDPKQDKNSKVADETKDLSKHKNKRDKYITKLTSYLMYMSSVN